MLNRREFLYRSGVAGATTALSFGNTACVSFEEESSANNEAGGGTGSPVQASASSTLIEAPPPDDEVHLLQRTSFGVTNESLAYLRQVGIDSYLEEALQPEFVDDSAAEAVIAAEYPVVLLDGPTLGASDQPTRQSARRQLRDATIHRSLYSRRQLQDVVVDFWTNHFSIDARLAKVSWYKVIDDREVIRRHALGKFRDLLHASARSAAMLEYLNNAANVKSAPNENYARELMELHTLGIDGGYTEEDIKEVARCFTGWRISGADISLRYVDGQHDDGEKTVLGRTIPAGGGISDGEQVLDMLASHPSTARFISLKLARRFVMDEPPDTLVTALADVFLSTDGDITAVLRRLFRSDEFRTSQDAKFKRPMEFVASAVRVLMPDYPGYTGPGLVTTLQQLGQEPFTWPTPDGYPDYTGHWNSTQGMAARWAFALGLAEAAGQQSASALDTWLTDTETPNQLVDVLTDNILHRPLTATDRDQFVSIATGDLVDADTALPPQLIKEKAVVIAAAMLSSPYFMVR